MPLKRIDMHVHVGIPGDDLAFRCSGAISSWMRPLVAPDNLLAVNWRKLQDAFGGDHPMFRNNGATPARPRGSGSSVGI